MDWLPDNWPLLLVVGALLLILLVRVLIALPIFRPPPRHSGERTIRVVGVGGAGGNAINHMIRAKQRGVDYIAINTDAQVLEESLATPQVQIGEQLTQGLGAGGDAVIGRRAAEEDAEAIGRALAGSDLVFIAAGLGGGTGSGAAPVIGAQARAGGALTVGVVTRPFSFEGTTRRRIADEAAEALRSNVDTLLLIDNDRVSDMISDDTTMLDAFGVVNEVLAQTVRAVVDIMTVPGLINLDFADVRTVMRDGGTALTGIGWASGEDRAVEAARKAVANPLLDHDVRGARAILLNVAGASGMTMREVSRAAEEIRSAADPDATIIFGAIFDDRLHDDLRVTVIATRFGQPADEGETGRAQSDAGSVQAGVSPAVAKPVVAGSAVVGGPVAADLPGDSEPRAEAAPGSPETASDPLPHGDGKPVVRKSVRPRSRAAMPVVQPAAEPTDTHDEPTDPVDDAP